MVVNVLVNVDPDGCAVLVDDCVAIICWINTGVLDDDGLLILVLELVLVGLEDIDILEVCDDVKLAIVLSDGLAEGLPESEGYGVILALAELELVSDILAVLVLVFVEVNVLVCVELFVFVDERVATLITEAIGDLDPIPVEDAVLLSRLDLVGILE